MTIKLTVTNSTFICIDPNNAHNDIKVTIAALRAISDVYNKANYLIRTTNDNPDSSPLLPESITANLYNVHIALTALIIKDKTIEIIKEIEEISQGNDPDGDSDLIQERIEEVTKETIRNSMLLIHDLRYIVKRHATNITAILNHHKTIEAIAEDLKPEHYNYNRPWKSIDINDIEFNIVKYAIRYDVEKYLEALNESLIIINRDN